MSELFTDIGSLFLLVIAFLNVLSLLLFCSDKKRAKRRKRRISEKTLLISTFSLGGIGALLGMRLFRHKTKHRLFILAVPLAALLTFGSILFILSRM